jgi:phosphoserine aminotransferase
MQYLQMLIIFYEQQYHFYSNERVSSNNIPVVCDMSSDIFSRVLDFSKFDLIYAGAQKKWDQQELL